MKIITGSFKSSQEAIETAEYLRKQGFKGEISVIGPHNEEIFQERKEAQNDVDGIKSMADYGIVGGLIGLSVGAISFMLPGVGQLSAFGPIAGLIGGASSGALAGQAIAALNRWGASKQEGEDIRRIIESGNAVILIKSEENDESFVRNALEDQGAQSIL